MEKLRCKYCENICVKNGFHANGKQRFKCKCCGKRQLVSYKYNAYNQGIDCDIISLTKEGLGIRSLSRHLKISTTTVIRRILEIAHTIKKPIISMAKKYEVDEICTFIERKSRQMWICYAIERITKQVVDFRIGSRSNKTLNGVVQTLILSEAKQIYTDGLKNYKTLIPKHIHKTIRFGTNHIERMNLNLRTHLKRLNRRTIDFSKSLMMLSAVWKIYFGVRN